MIRTDDVRGPAQAWVGSDSGFADAVRPSRRLQLAGGLIGGVAGGCSAYASGGGLFEIARSATVGIVFGALATMPFFPASSSLVGSALYGAGSGFGGNLVDQVAACHRNCLDFTSAWLSALARAAGGAVGGVMRASRPPDQGLFSTEDLGMSLVDTVAGGAVSGVLGVRIHAQSRP